MRQFLQFRKFVLALSGAHGDVLEFVPSERVRFESLGWAILITSCLATISMWFALATALGVNGIVAIPFALIWGLVIMGVDRWLITSMPIDGGRKWAMAVPRVLLALLLGTLISTPLVLRIFQSEINAQMAQMQQGNYNTFLQQQQSSQVDQQVTTYGNELSQLNIVIASHGQETGNTAADPQLVAYNKQLTQLESQLSHWTGLKTQYYNAYTCQLYGGPNCPKKGAGPAAAASHQSYLQASQQVTSYQGQISQVQQEIQQRDQTLNSTSKSAQQTRYQQALTAQPTVQQEYNAAIQRRNQLQATFFAQEQASHGILMRLEALSQLSAGNPTVTGARILLFLLFLVIECLPVTVKLLQRPGQYEAALQKAKEAERRDFEKFFATRSRLSSGGRGPALLQLRPEPEPSPEPIWHQTQVLPLGMGELGTQRPPQAPQAPFSPGAADGPAPDYGATAETLPRYRWHGEEEYRNHWETPSPDEILREKQRTDRRPPDAYEERFRQESPVAETRHELAIAPTMVDAGRADGASSDGGRGSARPVDEAGEGPNYGQDQLSFDDKASESGDAAASGRSDSNGAGIPLSWDDE